MAKEEKVKVICARCGKPYLIPKERYDEMKRGPKDKTDGGYVCNKCSSESDG